jgi:hypothetical protein
MNEYINLTLENIDEEHICCAIGDKKHQAGVDSKKEWIKSKLKDGHIFRKLNTRGKIFIEYEPIETAWIPISGKNYELDTKKLVISIALLVIAAAIAGITYFAVGGFPALNLIFMQV